MGAGIVGSILEAFGWQTTLFNFPVAGGRPAPLPLPDALSYLSPFILPDETGPASFFSGYRRFGPPDGDAARLVLESEPDAVFVSLFAFAYADCAISLVRALREKAPKLSVYIGGAGFEVYPDYCLRTGLFDGGIEGEAETALPRFLSRLGKGEAPGRPEAGVTAHGGEIEPFVSVLRETDRDVFAAAVVSRGCPMSCAFCSNRLTQGRVFRTAPIGAVAKRLAALPRGKRLFLDLEDDNLLLDPDYLFAVIAAARDGRDEVLFSAENGLDYMLMDDETVDRLVEAGFRQFNLSLASGDAKVLAAESRRGDIARLSAIVRRLANQGHGDGGIPSVVYFICGLPGDTPDAVVDTILTIDALPSIIGISPFYPVPGIEGFENRDLFSGLPSLLAAGSSCRAWTGSMTTAQIVTAFRLSRLSNLAKKKGRTPLETELLAKAHGERRILTMRRGRAGFAEVQGLDGDIVERFFTR